MIDKAIKPANLFCLSGVVALVFYVLHDVVGTMCFPGYDWMSQAVSDLTAIDAPSYVIASGLSSLYGLFACLCSAMVCVAIQGRPNKAFRTGIYLFTAMHFVSAIGYTLFPLSESGYADSFQDIVHVYVVTVLVVALSIVSLALIIIGGFKGSASKPMAIAAALTLLLMIAGVIGVNAVPAEYFGIPERFSTYGAVIFTAVMGIYGFAVKRYNDVPGKAADL